MSRFHSPRSLSNPGCASTHHQVPAASPQSHPPPKLPVEFSPRLYRLALHFPKAEMSLSLLPAAGGAAPGPVQRGARVDTHKGPSPSQPSSGGTPGAGRAGGSPPQAPPPPRTADPRAPRLPFPRPHSRRRGQPAALPPPAARAAAPPPRRAGGSWLPRGPSEGRQHGGLRAGPHPGTGVQTPGTPADAGTRTRRKPAELEDVPGRPRRAPPTQRTGARSRAGSRQGLESALRDAETAG